MKKTLTAIIIALILINCYLIYLLFFEQTLIITPPGEIIPEGPTNNYTTPSIIKPRTTYLRLDNELANTSMQILHPALILAADYYYNESALKAIGYDDASNVISAFAEIVDYGDEIGVFISKGFLYVIKLIEYNPYAAGFYVNDCDGELTFITSRGVPIASCDGSELNFSKTVINDTMYLLSYNNWDIRMSINQLVNLIEQKTLEQ